MIDKNAKLVDIERLAQFKQLSDEEYAERTAKYDSHLDNVNNPHAVTKTHIGLENVTNDAQVKRSEMGVVGGVATLNETGKVPSSQLPAFVDEVEEYTSKDLFPAEGGDAKIYIDTTTSKSYRWSGTRYSEISESIALGETSSTAYAGDKGKANALAIESLLLSVAALQNNPLYTHDEFIALSPKKMTYYFVCQDEVSKARGVLWRVYLKNKPIFEFDEEGNISSVFPMVFPFIFV